MSINPEKTVHKSTAAIDQEILAVFSRSGPLAYKDPRISYTLPVWERLIPKSTKFVCVFRSPMATGASTLKECSEMPYLASLKMNETEALRVWINIYSHVIKHYRSFTDRFIILHVDQILLGDGLARLSSFLNCPLDRKFVDKRLSRTKASPILSNEAKALYQQLCELAHHDINLV